MKTLVPVRLALFAISVVSLASCSSVDQKAVLDGSRRVTYGLLREGLASFSATVTPDWQSTLKMAKWRADDSLVHILDTIRFLAVMNDSQRIVIHRMADSANDLPAKYTELIKGNMGTLKGVFDLWDPCVLYGDPLIEERKMDDSAYHIRREGSDYIVNQYVTFGTVQTTLASDYSVKGIEGHTEHLQMTMTPKFTKTPHGLLLTSWDASMHFSSKLQMTMTATVEYLDTSGIKLPHVITVDETVNGTHILQHWTLSNYTFDINRPPPPPRKKSWKFYKEN